MGGLFVLMPFHVLKYAHIRPPHSFTIACVELSIEANVLN